MTYQTWVKIKNHIVTLVQLERKNETKYYRKVQIYLKEVSKDSDNIFIKIKCHTAFLNIVWYSKRENEYNYHSVNALASIFLLTFTFF